MQTTRAEDANPRAEDANHPSFIIPIISNRIIHRLMNRLSMVHGSWLKGGRPGPRGRWMNYSIIYCEYCVFQEFQSSKTSEFQSFNIPKNQKNQDLKFPKTTRWVHVFKNSLQFLKKIKIIFLKMIVVFSCIVKVLLHRSRELKSKNWSKSEISQNANN